MSPEQTMGTKAIDHRSDLYAMGVVAFYCLAGTPPFVSEGLGELIMMINSQPPPSMSHFRTDIPAPVEQWLMRSLAKSPGARFQDAKQMSAALVLAFEQSSGLSLGPSSAGGSGHAGVSTPVMPGKQARHGSVPDQWADEDDRTHVATPGGLPSTQKPAATVGAGPLATAATIADTPVGLRAPGGSFFQEKPSTLDGSSTASESRPQATVPLRWVLGGVAALAVTGVSAALTWSALSDKPAATSTAAAVSATASAAAPATSASAEPSTAPSSSAAKPVDINSLPASAAGAAGKTDTSGGRKSSKKDATPEKKDPPVEKPAPAEKPAETTEPPKKKNSKWD
jgi:serine/threonine-protein kinase